MRIRGTIGVRGGVNREGTEVVDDPTLEQVDDPTLEQEVERLRAELLRERELRVAAEAVAAERETALAEAARALTGRSRRRFRSPSKDKLHGNWLR